MSWFRQRDDTTEHSYFEERLSAYLDGELPPREQETVQEHLAGCPACRWDLSTLRQTVQWSSELPTVQVPRVFTIPIPAEPARTARRRWTLLPVLQGATALIALLLVFAVAGDAMLTGFAPRSQSELPAIQAPAPVVETTVVEQPLAAQEQATVVVEKESEAEAAAAAALPEEPPPVPEGEGERMLQVAPSWAVTATQTALADVQEAAEATMGGGLGGTDAEATGTVEEYPTLAGTPAPEAVEVIPPTPSPLPSLEAPATRAAVAPPTSEVVASKANEEVAAADQETQVLETRAIRAPTISWLRMVEYVLGVALILLVGTTLALWVWRRMMG